ncbi:hypothetical protein BGZ51_004946 [Haplosporangium sp. Z 767]|nr:hypothetical protein BGZ51_004946 [Haplosporangium sp. Z 767]
MTDFNKFSLTDSNSRFPSFFKCRPPIKWTSFREFVDPSRPLDDQYQKYILGLHQIADSPEVPPDVQEYARGLTKSTTREIFFMNIEERKSRSSSSHLLTDQTLETSARMLMHGNKHHEQRFTRYVDVSSPDLSSLNSSPCERQSQRRNSLRQTQISTFDGDRNDHSSSVNSQESKSESPPTYDAQVTVELRTPETRSNAHVRYTSPSPFRKRTSHQRDDEHSHGPEEEPDIVTQAECGYIFQVDPFDFVAQVGDYDLGSAFTMYFERCRSLAYNKDAASDFL